MDQKKLVAQQAAQHFDLTKKIVSKVVTPKLSHRVYTDKDISEIQEKLTKELDALYLMGVQHAMRVIQNKVAENKKTKNR